ncbi:hypothetical protein vseg_019585 [Gypsophila vaccaria]
MAFKKTLVQRLFNLSRFSTPTVCRTSTVKPQPPSPNRRPLHQSTAAGGPPPSMTLFPMTGALLSESLREMDITRGRLNLDGLVAARVDHAEPESVEVGGLTVGEVRKVLRAAQAEMIRSKLSEVGKEWIKYHEFVAIVEEFCGGNKEEARSFARTLDESGTVIVLGNSVCLRPHQEIRTLVRQIYKGLHTIHI